MQRILQMDFQADWRGCLMAVREYVFEGNAGTDYENSFYLEDNTVRDWFHVPWQHRGETGREGVHGLTQEGPIAPFMLAPTQPTDSHAYAVGFYNDLGGYTLGRAWPDATAPDFSYFAAGNGFPEGTVVAKVLFTTLDETEVKFLVNPVTWNAYVYSGDVPGSPDKKKNKDGTAAREFAPVRLVQMDIMVRDKRADATGGWVFGNSASNGAMGSANRWENLVPVGVMWGNDPDVRESYIDNTPGTPTKWNPTGGTWINPALTETVINPDADELPDMHLGWSGRLNGPLDNTASSCMSCHSTAEYPVRSAIMPFLNDPVVKRPVDGTQAGDAWMRWFRNMKCATPFDPGAISLDYSLQLVKSVENDIDWREGSEQGRFAVEYDGEDYTVGRSVPSADG